MEDTFLKDSIKSLYDIVMKKEELRFYVANVHDVNIILAINDDVCRANLMFGNDYKKETGFIGEGKTFQEAVENLVANTKATIENMIAEKSSFMISFFD